MCWKVKKRGKRNHQEREECTREGRNDHRKPLTLVSAAAAQMLLSCCQKMSVGREEASGSWQEGSKCWEGKIRKREKGKREEGAR